MEKWRTASKEESNYFDEIEEKNFQYASQYDGSYEAFRGDYEGAILARDEFNSGRVS